jgi:hypothetical protein
MLEGSVTFLESAQRPLLEGGDTNATPGTLHLFAIMRKLASVLILGFVVLALPLMAAAQAFEVASVKPNTSRRPGNVPPITTSANRFQTTGASLSMILQFAYRTSTGRALRRIDIMAHRRGSIPMTLILKRKPGAKRDRFS